MERASSSSACSSSSTAAQPPAPIPLTASLFASRAMECASSSSSSACSSSTAVQPTAPIPLAASLFASRAMERASSSSSSACSSSSTTAQPPATFWFPSSMKEKAMRLTVRKIDYTGHVNFVNELESLLHFKLPKPDVGRRPHFVKGDLATLKSREGSRWSGEIISINEDKSSLCTILSICAATCWFPSHMKEQEMRLSVRGIGYTGRVGFVDELKSLLNFKLLTLLPKPAQPRFIIGDLATLEMKEGRRWLGEIIFIDEDEDKEGLSSLDTTLRIRVPPAGEVLESLENIAVAMKPVAKLEPSQEVVKVGIKGFGKIERFLVEMGLQSIDVEVVAIQSPSMSPQIMAKEWKSQNVSVSVKDSETLVFTRRYYDANPRKKGVVVLLEHKEVTVLREPNQIPWERANVDFIVECSTFFNKDTDDQSQVTNKTEGSNNCFRCLPKVLDAFGLYTDGIIRAKFHDDDHKTARRAAKFNIVTRSSAAVNAICHADIFPDWNKDPSSMSFLATASPAVLHRLADIDMSNVDLQLTLVNAENCTGIDGVHTRFCDADAEVHRRLKAIMSWCLDIIRCMSVGACCLELA